MPRKGATDPVREQVVFGPGIPASSQPSAQTLGCLGAEEPYTILVPLASSDCNGAGSEVHVLDAQAQGLGDAQPAVSQEGDQGPIAAPLEGGRARLQQSPA